MPTTFETPPVFNPQNDVDILIATRLAEIWKNESEAWNPSTRKEFKQLATRACVTAATCTASSHKIHRGITGRKITEAKYIVLAAMFGTNSLQRLGWWAEFQKSSKTYIVEPGVVTPKLRGELKAAAKKVKSTVVGSDVKPKIETLEQSRLDVDVKPTKDANHQATSGVDGSSSINATSNALASDIPLSIDHKNDETAQKSDTSNSRQQGPVTRKRKRGDSTNNEQSQDETTSLTAEQKLAEILAALARGPKRNRTLRARVEVLEARYAVQNEKIERLEALVLSNDEDSAT